MELGQENGLLVHKHNKKKLIKIKHLFLSLIQPIKV